MTVFDSLGHSAIKGDILIVDDTLDNLRLLATMLKTRGYRVRSAKSGLMALAGIQADPPELIMMDITMPDMDGYEVCRRLKQDEQMREIPVIFISALDEVLDKVRAFEAGGVDYITKPFQIDELVARIENQLTIQRLQKQLREQNADLQSANKQLQEVNSQLESEIQERQRAERALQLANQELERLASLDGLTKVANRRCFNDYFQIVWQEALQNQSPITSILCDVDYFKLFNDTYGHQAGDECLQQIAEAIQMSVSRSGDLVARYGGEEFIVLLPQTVLTEGIQIAESIQNRVASLQIPHEASSVSSIVSLSMGIASLVPTPTMVSELLVQSSDQALYTAKRQGRNQIVTYSARL